MYENELVDIPVGLFGHRSICSNNRIATCKTHIEGRIPMALFFLRFSFELLENGMGVSLFLCGPLHVYIGGEDDARPFFLHFATLFGVLCEK